MEATARLNQPKGISQAFPALDFQVLACWALGFGLTLYLGLRGGGFDPLVTDKVGITVWWIVLVGLLVGAFPRRRPGVPGWVCLGLLAAFLGWTALSLIWTESHGNTNEEVARVATYLGVFALGLSVRGPRGLRLMVSAVGSAIAVIALVALLSRLHPGWFDNPDQTASFLHSTRNRLAFPLNYWNALAALIGVGAPLILNLGTTSRSVLVRSVAIGTLPAMALAAYFTLSRGGILAGIVAVLVYLALVPDRVTRLVPLALATAGGAILIGAASQRHDLQEGMLNSAAHHQGTEMLWMTIVVCVGVGLLHAAFSIALVNGRRPAWTVPSRRTTLIAAGGALFVVIVAAVALNAPLRISHAVDEFKQGEGAGENAGRLTSAAGENRYKYWSATIDEFKQEPFHGTGPGTFEFWWARHGDTGAPVRDAHSLYLQTLAELGAVGIALLGSFFVSILVFGARATARASSRGRPQLAAALAGVVAFMVAAAVDWVWQVPVLPVTMLLLAGPLITAGVRSRRRPKIKVPFRASLAILALAAIVAIAIPLTGTSLIRQSQDDARSADLTGALDAARSAQNVEPDSGLPYLQESLVLERAGDYTGAVLAAQKATRHEEDNWRNWLILSRVQAERGRARPAVRSYQIAAGLNPHLPVPQP